jgi:N-acetylneuraminic acid mutarotase
MRRDIGIGWLRGLAGGAAVVTLVACGGGGGGSSSTPTGAAPTISNLQYSPQSAYASTTPTIFTGQLNFTDPDGDLASATLTVLGSGGAVVSMVTTPIQGAAGVTSGALQGSVNAALPAADNYSLQVYVTDARGLRSNTLSGAIRVTQFPWTTKAPPTIAREYAGVAALGGRLYVAGGQRTDQGMIPGPATAIVQVYDPQTNAWSAAPPMPTARIGLTVVAAGGKLYAIGGATDGFNNSTGAVEEFDPATQAWTPRAAMPTARHFAAAALVNGRIVVAGGRTQATDLLATVESYDPANNTWASGASMPAPRREVAGVELGGRLLAVGGYGDLMAQWLSTVEAYDPVANVWAPRASMAERRSHLAIAVVNGRAIVAGGENFSRALDVLETYDPVANAWTVRTPSPTPFTRAAAGVVNDRVYVFGNGLTLEYVPANDIR